MPAPKTIEELVMALQSAPQEKEGAFRIATWNMVLSSFLEMQEKITELEAALGIVEKKADATAKTPDIATITKAVKDDLSKADANKVLF